MIALTELHLKVIYYVEHEIALVQNQVVRADRMGRRDKDGVSLHIYEAKCKYLCDGLWFERCSGILYATWALLNPRIVTIYRLPTCTLRKI